MDLRVCKSIIFYCQGEFSVNLNSQNVKKIIFIIFCAALFFAGLINISTVFSLVKRIISFFTPVIAALCIAFVLNVLMMPIENRLFAFLDNSKKRFVPRLKRPLAIVLTYILALGIVATAILVIIPDLIDTVIYLAGKMPAFIDALYKMLGNLLDKFNIEYALPEIKIDWSMVTDNLENLAKVYGTRILNSALGITTSVFNGVFDVFFSVVLSVYILAQKEKIGRFVKALLTAVFPKKFTEVVLHIAEKTAESFTKFISGQCIEALILGTLCFIGMLIFGFPNALIISLFVAITALIPIIGATVGAVIGFLLIVITDPVKAVLFVVFLIVLQQIEGNLIYPKVVGKAVGLPAVIVISSVLVGGNIGGVLGALIGVPTSAAIYTLLKEYIAYKKESKEA